MSRIPPQTVWVLLALASALFPKTARGQDRPVTLGVGTGLLVPYQRPDMLATDLLASAQIPLAPHFGFEAEVTRSFGREGVITGSDARTDRPFVPVSTVRERRDSLTLGANLLFHTGGPKTSFFAGAGLGVHRTTRSVNVALTCETRVVGACDASPDTSTDSRKTLNGLRSQLVGGVDRALAPRITAFGSVRWRFRPDAGLGVMGGVRVGVGPARAQRSASNAEAAVQTVQGATPNAPALRIPRLMVSFGTGSARDPEGHVTGVPLTIASVQFLPRRHVVVEGDLSYWAGNWNNRWPGIETRGPLGQLGFSGDSVDTGTRRGWSSGVNFLFRTEPRRVAWFAGGGPLMAHTEENVTYRTEGCVAPGFNSCSGPYQYSDNKTRPGAQGLTGVDVGIAGPLRAYASLHFTTVEYSYVRVAAGVRFVPLTQRADSDAQRRARRVADSSAVQLVPGTSAPGQPPPLGKEVRLSLASGSRTSGMLVSLTATEVAVRRGGRDVRYPLDQVLLVETVHHTARTAAIVAAIAGFVGGYLGSCGGGDEEDCWPEVGAMFAGIGAGTAALIGAGIDTANASKHIVYAAPVVAASPTVLIRPVATPTKAGIAVAVGW